MRRFLTQLKSVLCNTLKFPETAKTDVSINNEVVYDGIKLNISSDYISPKMKQQLNTAYETSEIELINKYINPNDKVLEAGVGIGLTALIINKNIGVNKYVGLEANPFLVEIIKQNQQLNSCDFELLNVALSSESGNIPFNLNSDFWSSSIIKRNNTYECINVKSYAIDDLFKILSFKPNTLVVDIEGAETELLQDSIAFFNKILIELHPHIIGEKQVSRIVTYLIQKGFRLVDYSTIVYYFEK